MEETRHNYHNNTMPANATEYDPRYLEGIRLFNAGEYFDAHEVWEELWMDGPPTERLFHKSLIHAAVSLYHASSGNERGALRLLETGKRYASLFTNPYHGLDHESFWQSMHLYLQSRTAQPTINANSTLVAVPRIHLASDL